MCEFRNYKDVNINIKNNYKKAREYQTLEYVTNMKKKYLNFNNKLKLKYVFKELEKFVDISDPDITLPNFYHGIQTAEAIRLDGHPEWLQLVGLIHDIGKIIYLRGCDKDGTSIKEQWGIVGDTFIVGCKIPETIVYPEFNHLNKDMKNPLYNTNLGIYKNNCGLNNVTCSWGHDEYLYQVLKYNKTLLPVEALYIIRFHSLYLHHLHNEYSDLIDEHDRDMFKYLKLFNKYDLYTKTDNFVLDNDILNYYDKLINKYIKNSELYF
tara:strand:+ start:1367 stop:2164 length:798 start_codon:yes stop_codon:yes gene_type:complete